jgi:tRNA G18 (ribose-2'-O)-methylase SpoU
LEQLTHHNIRFETKTFPITVICDEVYLLDNIGSIFRICDSFGVTEIIFTGENFIFSERKINRTSRNTHKKVPFQIVKNKQTLIEELKKKDCNIISLEITSISQPLEKFKEKLQKPLVLIIGNEINGISNEFLSISKNHLHINMYGENSSMNVSHSLGIALFQIINYTF